MIRLLLTDKYTLQIRGVFYQSKLFPTLGFEYGADRVTTLGGQSRFGCYSILFYSILFYSTLLYSILFYSTLLYSILFYSIILYFVHIGD